MASTYDQLINELWDRYDVANGYRSNLNNARSAAYAQWAIGDDHDAIEYIIDGMQSTVYYMVAMLAKGFYGHNGSTYALLSALDRTQANPFITSDDVPAITMQSILDAMVTANPDQTMYFVGLLDAFKQSVWNRPYNKEFFAALARGFMEWP